MDDEIEKTIEMSNEKIESALSLIKKVKLINKKLGITEGTGLRFLKYVSPDIERIKLAERSWLQTYKKEKKHIKGSNNKLKAMNKFGQI